MESDNDFFSFLHQVKDLVTSNRPLRLRLDLPGGVNDDMLLPQRVFGSESICGGIEYRVLCVSARVDLPLKQLIAVPASLDFVTDRGGLRSVCGLITEAASGDSDGGLASYQLVLRDALSILEKRTNTRIYRNTNEVEVVKALLNEWRQRSPILGTGFSVDTEEGFELCEYPEREFIMQHNESDAAFIRRLLKRRGIGWYIRSQQDAEYPFHTLMLFNDADSLRQNAACTVRYHRDNATEERDTITSWSAVRSLQPGSVSRHSWDYLNPLGSGFMAMQMNSSANQGVHGNELSASLDDYLVLPPHAGDDSEDLCTLGRLRMNRLDYESKCFHGEGSVRDLCAGEYFTLTGHAEVDSHPDEERDFIVTALQLTAYNNLPKALAARVERLFARNRWMMDGSEQWQRDLAEQVASGPMRMHIQFTAVRRGIPIVPAYDPRVDVPQAQMQSAMVVGPDGEEVHCDEMGRVKIRFPATREEDHESGAGASDTDRDSAWVRVASNWAGNGPGSLGQCGTLGLPRVGSEVLVAFLSGDPDKPVIVGQLYNQNAKPIALSSAGELPGNRYLSGIKSREIKGGRANQLRLDDTEGQISAQLASDHGESQLNLGFLTQPRAEGAGEPRGEGAELRSDLNVSIRGQQGVLITAEPSDAQSGKSLDREELINIAEGLQKLAKQLNEQAESHAGDSAGGSELGSLIDKLKSLDDEGAPIIAVSGPAGLISASTQNVAIGAATTIDVISAGATALASGDTTTIRSVQGMSLYANEGGMKLTAGGGAVAIQAQDDHLQLLAKKVLEVISNTDWITIKAKRGVRINGGGTELELSPGGIKGYTSGKHEMYASDHQTFPGQSRSAEFSGDPEPHKICVPCLLAAANAHSPFAQSEGGS